jgi:hypothetical protein
MTLPHRVSAHLAVLALVTAMLTMASTGVAAARDPGSDLERVTKSGEELVKSGSATFRGTHPGKFRHAFKVPGTPYVLFFAPALSA